MRKADLLSRNNITNGTISNGISNGEAKHGFEDKRLSMFGYTTETINMLLLPMIKNK